MQISEWQTIHRFPQKQSADVVCEKLKQIIRGANVSVQLKEISDEEKRRGVGRWAICFECKKSTDYIIIKRMSDACSAALQLALADELAKLNPNHHLLTTWHLDQNNRTNYHKYDFSDM